MLSLDNAYNAEETRQWEARLLRATDDVRPTYVVEPKVDGVSVAVHYRDGGTRARSDPRRWPDR